LLRFTPIYDLSVFTREFLDDVGITEIKDLIE
jgi:hypothetical protein